MSGAEIAIVAGLILLVALAVAAGLQHAADRAEERARSDGDRIRERLRQHPDVDVRYCPTCGRPLDPPPRARKAR
jgi:hypothetical protein